MENRKITLRTVNKNYQDVELRETKVMNKRSGRRGPKVVFWISVFCVIFVGIAITTDAFVYRLPVLVSDRIYPVNITSGSYIPVNFARAEQFSDSSISSSMSALRKPKTHVAFLKVHKAGSTTMQNLFFRFALRHKLNILLPRSGNYLWPKSLRMNLKSGQHYDIFACHTIYNKTWFDSLLPADSVNIGIVREPVSRIISAAYYYRDKWGVGYLKKVPRANFIHNLVNFPEKYDTSFFSQTRNRMGEDFGFKRATIPENTVEIRQYLDDLNSQFLLVLIMEKFDESLVLMKRVLNWSLVDILYLKTNSHAHKPIVLNKTKTDKVRKTNFLDFEIYEYFTKVFETKLQQADKSFSDEVKFFKTVLEQVREFCSKVNKPSNATLVIPSSKWDSEFKVSNIDCEWMETKELPFIKKLRDKHLYSQ